MIWAGITYRRRSEINFIPGKLKYNLPTINKKSN